MAAEIDLFNDTVNERLVRSLTNEESFQFQSFHQGSVLKLRYWPLIPTYATRGAKFTKIPIAGLTLKAGIGPRAGAQALLASQTVWDLAFDLDGSGNGYLYADLDLNTTEMNTAIGSEDRLQTYFELVLNDGGVPRVVWQQPVTIYAVVFGPAGAASLPALAVSYYTAVEADAMFVRWNNDRVISRGKTITLYAPNGTVLRIIGVRNDGSAQDDIL